VLRIGDLTLSSPLVLAPMAGVTDRDFRRIVRRIGGCGLLTMEFISSKAAARRDPAALKLMEFDPAERPLSIQIYGSDAATMAEAARLVEELGADACDINMGCPANKVLKGCAGARLMGDLPLAQEIVTAVRRAIRIPLTVKFRLGLDDRRRNYLELGRLCQDAGADAVALHGRTARQMFEGGADWGAIARLVEVLSIPVLGNGDVQTAADVARMRAETGCAGVLIGRAATRNPWIFRQVEALCSGGAVPEPTLADRKRVILDHFRTVADREEPAFALHKLRTFSRWYTQGLPEGQRFRRRLPQLTDPPSFLRAVEDFFGEIEAAAAA
jgi:nifR3 family TIM-barrel protein